MRDQYQPTNGCFDGGKRSYAAAFDQLMSQLLNFMCKIDGLRDQRDELIQELQAKTAVPVFQSLKETFDQMMNNLRADSFPTRNFFSARTFMY